MNPKDYEITDGEYKCDGCCFDNNGKCIIQYGQENAEAFKNGIDGEDCWDVDPWIDDDDPEIIHYRIYKLKWK